MLYVKHLSVLLMKRRMQVVHLTFFSLGNRIHGPRPNLPADKRYPVLLQYFSFYHTIIYQTHPTVNFTKTRNSHQTPIQYILKQIYWMEKAVEWGFFSAGSPRPLSLPVHVVISKPQVNESIILVIDCSIFRESRKDPLATSRLGVFPLPLQSFASLCSSGKQTYITNHLLKHRGP